MFTMRRARGARARSAARTMRNLRTWVISAVLAAAAVVYVCLPEDATLPQVTADPPPQAFPPRQPYGAPTNPGLPVAPAAPGAPAAQVPLDPAIRLLNESAQAYAGVRDYTCTMVKQERIRGVLQPEHLIQMKFRVQPFSVYMKWFGPKQFVGQEVCYVQGKNQGMMRVHAPGLIGAFGFVSIAPNDPKAMEHSRHKITEAGIGNLIERMRSDWTRDRLTSKARVTLAEYQYNQRPCVRIEVTQTEWTPQTYCGRAVLYLDKETHLPVRTEVYDFPRPGSQPGGDLLESFSYINMRVNVGLSDADFNY